MSTTSVSELQLVVVMSGQATDDEVEGVLARLAAAGSESRVTPGRSRRSSARPATGSCCAHSASRAWRGAERPADPQALQARLDRDVARADRDPGARAVASAASYFALIAGPCTVESREQTLTTARAVHAAGASMLRGGAFKPRTSPYSFRGLGEAGARDPRGGARGDRAARRHRADGPPSRGGGVGVGRRDPDRRPQHAELQLLLAEVGQGDRPVLLKRGPSASIEELLMAAEYILSEGNPRVILCERGIRSFDRSIRYTLDVGSDPGAAGGDAPPRGGRPVPRRRPAGAGPGPRPGGRGGGRRRDHRRGRSRSRRPRCATLAAPPHLPVRGLRRRAGTARRDAGQGHRVANAQTASAHHRKDAA